VHEFKNALYARIWKGIIMGPSTIEDRLSQSRAFKRTILRKLQQKTWREGSEIKEVYYTIASEFLCLPSLDNVDRLSTVYGYARVRKAISLLDNLVFEDFFYGKFCIYPMWMKQFARLLDAARPRAIVRELMTSSGN
jgi:hypothetical protein